MQAAQNRVQIELFPAYETHQMGELPLKRIAPSGNLSLHLAEVSELQLVTTAL